MTVEQAADQLLQILKMKDFSDEKPGENVYDKIFLHISRPPLKFVNTRYTIAQLAIMLGNLGIIKYALVRANVGVWRGVRRH